MESRYIFCCWYGLCWREWCSNVHCEAYTAMYLRENRFDHLIFTSKKKSVLKQNITVIYDMRIRPEVRKNILRKIYFIMILFFSNLVCGVKTLLAKCPQRASLPTLIITVVRGVTTIDIEGDKSPPIIRNGQMSPPIFEILALICCPPLRSALVRMTKKSFKSNIFSLLCLSRLTALVNVKIIELANQIKVGGV